MLFGAAVVLIIGAALFVPWQRMEQLTHQINERTASTLAEWAVAEHVAREQSRRLSSSSGPPATIPAARSSHPADPNRPGVRLLLLSHGTVGMNRAELHALDEFRQHADPDAIVRTQRHRSGATSVHFIRPLHASAKSSCIECHVPDIPPEQVGARRAPLLGMVSVQIPYQIEAKEVFLNRLIIFLALMIAGPLAIVVFYLITTRLILGPVRVLQETAEKVSQGNLNIRSDISTGDEFQQLSETFNRMLENLQQSEDQLRAINKSLDLKLGQLAESNLALYESNRLKSEFLANVSHELRTPLNSILGFAELLKDTASADPKAVRYVQNIVSSGKNLLELINDLLDLAKIEAGKMEVRSEPLSLPDLFEGLVSIIKPLTERREISVTATVDRDVPILQSDPPKLQQVLYNFLSNAIKFSPQAGRIDIRAERVGNDHVKIAVIDQGPGIPPDKQLIIFEKFRQIDASVTREHSGTGLGLSISKELVQLLGGSIGVQSQLGQGATFWIILPLRTQPGPQPLQFAHEAR